MLLRKCHDIIATAAAHIPAVLGASCCHWCNLDSAKLLLLLCGNASIQVRS
jgi:hypothetical protein